MKSKTEKDLPCRTRPNHQPRASLRAPSTGRTQRSWRQACERANKPPLQAQQAPKIADEKPASDTVEVSIGAGEAKVYIGPGGRVESELEYNARIAHNTYMRFYRSFQRFVVANRALCQFIL